jgi:hypothetical protein
MSMRSPTTRPVVVSGSDDATVRVWDLGARGLLYQPLEAHQGKVNAIAVGDLDGRPIAISGGNDRTVRVWDLNAGRPRGAPLVGHDRKVLAVAVGELGGRPIAVSGGNDKTVRVWDLDTGELIYRPLAGHDGNILAVAVGKLSGRPIAVSASDDFTVRVWDLAAGGPLGRPLEGHDNIVNAVAVGELDGRPIAVSGGCDKLLWVWDLAAGGPLGGPLAGHDDWVLAVAIGELDGRPIAVSGGTDDTMRVWDLAAGRPLGAPLVHDHFVNAVAVGEVRERSFAASGDAAETVRPVVATLPDPTGEAAMPLGSHRMDRGGSVGSGGKSSSASRRRDGRAGAARGSGVDTTKPRWLFVVSIGMVLVGLVVVVAAVRDLQDILRPPSSSRRADGVVIDLDVETCGSGSKTTTCYHPVVRFVTAREQVIEFTSNVGSRGIGGIGEYSVGDSVKVRYDPDNPRHARLDSAWDRLVSGFFDVVFLLVGLAVMLGGGLLLRREVRRMRRPAEG